MTIHITIDTDNAAFGDNPELEVARILNDLADRVLGPLGLGDRTLRDYYGNTVGTFFLAEHVSVISVAVPPTSTEES